MSDQKMPFVAIIGGFYHLNDPVVIGEAQKMAREIGAALAEAGMGIVVYNSDPHSLEPHVVAGYVQATPDGTGARSIRVRYADSQRNMIKFAEQRTRKELFDLRVFPGQNWELPFYQSLAEAEGVDAVLLMAGKTSTLIAAQIALARPLPVLVIDTFEGSAKDIWTELAIKTPGYPSASTTSIPDLVDGLKKKCETRAKELALVRKNQAHYQNIISKRSKTVWTGSSFLVLLFVIFLGVQQSPAPQWYPILTFIGLVVAGATGALVRSYYWGTEDIAPYTSLLLGGFAGFVVGLAYLIPQFIGAPGLLNSSATGVTSTDKIQFLSAILVAIPAGVGFDTIFNRLMKQAEEQLISPSGNR
ncbi:MAG TPA: hypothetical protein VGK56_09520 [Anaerolineales bacterium]